MTSINLKRCLQDNELDLSLNNLEDIPVKEIAKITKATSLDLSNNRLTNLPETFSQLFRINRLDLSKNHITSLPSNFGELSQLQYLDLRGNQLTHLPPSFAHLTKLKWLDLKDNPLESHLAEVAGDCLDEKQCQTAAKRVVAYMKTIEDRLEMERLDRLEREKKQEARRRKQEEDVLLKKREEKKLEKERKRKLREEKLKAAKQTSNGLNGDNSSSDNSPKTKSERKKKQSSGFSWFSIFMWLTTALLVTFIIFVVTCHEHSSNHCTALNKILPSQVKLLRSDLIRVASNYYLTFIAPLLSESAPISSSVPSNSHKGQSAQAKGT